MSKSMQMEMRRGALKKKQILGRIGLYGGVAFLSWGLMDILMAVALVYDPLYFWCMFVGLPLAFVGILILPSDLPQEEPSPVSLETGTQVETGTGLPPHSNTSSMGNIQPPSQMRRSYNGNASSSIISPRNNPSDPSQR
ncbi:MAG: hypothetical protein ACYTGQ_02930 [Planctomycetota bacterium]|jgi:hypothetical protein